MNHLPLIADLLCSMRDIAGGTTTLAELEFGSGKADVSLAFAALRLAHVRQDNELSHGPSEMFEYLDKTVAHSLRLRNSAEKPR